MKNLVIHTVLGLTLLLTLVAIFGGVHPVPAHALLIGRRAICPPPGLTILWFAYVSTMGGMNAVF
jgi:hypothetical protein